MTRRAKGEGGITSRPNGRFQGVHELPRLPGEPRRRQYVYGRTRAEVGIALAELRASSWNPSPKMLTATFLRRWLDDSKHLRPSTRRRYEQIVRVQLIPGVGHVPLGTLNPGHVQAMLHRLGQSPQTVRHVRAVLRTALNQAARWGLVRSNAAVPVSVPRLADHRVPAMSVTDARALADAIHGDHLEALYLLAMFTGLRQGELLGLRWQDVDLAERSLTVRHSLIRLSGGLYKLAEPKTARSRRTVTVPELAMTALREHRRRQLEERLTGQWAAYDLVFARADGTPLDGTHVTRSFQATLGAAGLPRMRFHDLRHAAASLMIAAGTPLRVVMEVLGHSTISLTANTYAHLVPELSRDAADRLDALLG